MLGSAIGMEGVSRWNADRQQEEKFKNGLVKSQKVPHYRPWLCLAANDSVLNLNSSGMDLQVPHPSVRPMCADTGEVVSCPLHVAGAHSTSCVRTLFGG
jgi:hypothetical protein